MATPKEMLSALIQRGQLKPREKEAFENMWDAVHRYGGLSAKQKAWVEKEYFGQKLDRSTPQAGNPKKPASGTFQAVRPEKKHYRIGYINYPGTQTTLLVTNMSQLRELCPGIVTGTPWYSKIEAFFRKGGEVIKIKPMPDKKSA
jgi:hypothetical protein